MGNFEAEEQTTRKPSQVREELINRITELKAQIYTRYSILNLEALWLFVATLGCWSVNQIFAQLIALALVPVLFFYKVFDGKKQETTFDKLWQEIRDDLEKSILEGDAKKARLQELDEIKKDLHLKSLYKKAKNFVAVYIFYVITVLIKVLEIFKIITL